MLALSEQYWYVIPAAIGVITLSVYLFLFLSDSSTVPVRPVTLMFFR